ncbi:MAG: CDP-alcohol phosphatidyltransferase family protein [Gammaproteobacteria bacterium]|jgi:phosphatidylglycerophosphate synthase|nr:CDP-alcohol phosphatidyltransferase family protein [Gammaproteobacteria bacterium]MDH3749236.1 CDP-alcohol phosphatidyltransferase family protein [Gammaproteobacteria bacterium]MDH3806093.1 CDP-alcohol phosphatidyltransferase family protein [Gammaproteobacteria bacterium]
MLSAADDSAASIDTWINVHAVVMLAATVVVFLLDSTIPVAAAALASFAYLLIRRGQAASKRRATGRYAHQLTLLRLLLLCYAAWRIGDIDSRWLLVLFSGNVLLDVIDGFIARRLNQATQFGMIFDREVDAIYVLVACLYFNIATGIAAWILVPGLLPYAYRLVAWAMGNPSIAGQRQSLAAFLAGVNFVLLLIAIAVPQDYRVGVLVISTAIVTLSFLVSFWRLVRHRYESPVL